MLICWLSCLIDGLYTRKKYAFKIRCLGKRVSKLTQIKMAGDARIWAKVNDFKIEAAEICLKNCVMVITSGNKKPIRGLSKRKNNMVHKEMNKELSSLLDELAKGKIASSILNTASSDQNKFFDLAIEAIKRC